jgi:hypothetical protein
MVAPGLSLKEGKIQEVRDSKTMTSDADCGKRGSNLSVGKY